jgi:phosphoribosyl 1,2-cyclic phosphodiesterase
LRRSDHVRQTANHSGRRFGHSPPGESTGAGRNSRILANILISHTHWDHIQGFPFFTPIFGRHNRFVLVGRKHVDQQLEEILAGQFIEPYLPFSYKSLPADLIVKEVGETKPLIVGDATRVTVANMNHPGGCLGFRIENNGSSLPIAAMSPIMTIISIPMY